MFYKMDSGENWHVRCAEQMNATRKDRVERRPEGYYTPEKCKAEFNRIMAEPCPADVPTGADYRSAAVVDAWIDFIAEEDRKDAEIYDNFMQMKMKSYEERLLEIWGNREAYTTEKLEKMLADFKAEIEEVEYDDEEVTMRERMGEIYMKHLTEAFYNHKIKKVSLPLRPTPAVTACEHKSEPALSSDIDATKSSSQAAQNDVEPVGVTTRKECIVEKMEVDDTESKISDTCADSTRNSSESRRSRGKQAKKSSLTEDLSVSEESPRSSMNAPEAKSPLRSETRRSITRSEAAATENTSVQVNDGPTGRVRNARRSTATDSSLPNVRRISAGAESKDSRECVKERDSLKSRHSIETSVRTSACTSDAVIKDEFGRAATQTAISIQIPLTFVSTDADVLPARKSSRVERRSAQAASSASAKRVDSYTQTAPVRLDPEDKVIVGWPLSDMKMAAFSFSVTPTFKDEDDSKSQVEFESQRTNTKVDLPKRVMKWNKVIAMAAEKKQKLIMDTPEEYIQVWEINYCDFSNTTLQGMKDQEMATSAGEKMCALVASPPKRARREEKPSSTITTLTPKGRMVSAWNLLQEHRHSAIFLHPVTDRDAPGYSRLVYTPVDLTTAKREIDNGIATSADLLMRKMLLMFSNAVMFNSTGHDVNSYAKEMFAATYEECVQTIDPRMDPYRVHHRRSRPDDPRRRSTLTPVAQARAPTRKRQ